MPQQKIRLLDRMLREIRYNVVKPYVPNDSEVLDIGGRDGSFLMAVQNKIQKGVCIDPLVPDTDMRKIKFVAGSVEDRIPFADNTFDIVTLIAVYEHLGQNRARVTKEIYRVLKPGGRALLTVPSAIVDDILKVLVTLKLLDGMSLEQHEHFNAAETVTIFKECGFALARWRRFELGLNNLFVFVK